MRFAFTIAILFLFATPLIAATTYDFATQATVTIMGPDAALSTCKSGYSVASGDIDNDGYDDFVIGAPGIDYLGGLNAGAVFVIWGNAAASLPSKYNLARTNPPAIDNADLAIYGQAGDGAGKSVAVSDVNNDGYDDVIIGAPDSTKGTVYIVYGRARSSFPAVKYIALGTGADVTIAGEANNDLCGTMVASGNLNGDSYNDIIIGAPHNDGQGGARADAGWVYVIYGSNSLPATINLATTWASVSVMGARAGDHLGDAGAIAVGDVNHDGIEDLVIGAWGGDKRDHSGNNEGEAYVIYGSSSLPSTWDLNTTAANYIIYGIDTNDQLGNKVACGDINGDSYAEIIMTAINGSGPNNSRSNCGDVYVVSGGSLSGYQELAVTAANYTLYGAAANDRFGYSLCAKSIKDNSSYKDLTVGAPSADGPSSTRPDGGNTYIFYGSGSFPSTWDINTTAADITAYGVAAGDECGSSAAIGNFDGDRLPDLFVGAPLSETSAGGRTDDGECYARLGVLPHGITGTVTFEDSAYTAKTYTVIAGEKLYVEVRDADLDISTTTLNTATVELISTASTTPDREILTLTETGLLTGIFRGTATTTTGVISSGNNIIEVVTGETVVVTYIDALDALGNINSLRMDSVLVLSQGGSPTTRVLARFTDSSGNKVNRYRLGTDGIYVTVTDLDVNFSPTTKETVTTAITESTFGDSETLILTETTSSSEVFRNLAALPSKSSSTPVKNDGILETLIMDSAAAGSVHLQALGGNTITTTYTNTRDATLTSSDTALIVPSANSLTPISYPDPNNVGTIIIRYYLASDTEVHLFIYDITANLVASEVYAAGSNGGKGGTDNIIRWNGMTDYNVSAANGVYLFKLAAKSGAAYSLLGKGKIYLMR